MCSVTSINYFLSVNTETLGRHFFLGGDGVALPFSKGEAGSDEVSHGIPGGQDP